MRPALLFPAITMLAALALAALPVAHAQGVVPLEYYNGGYLKPGWEYNYRLHAFGMTAVPIPVSHAFADAGIQLDTHKYGIVGDDGGGPTGHVYYLIDGEQIEVDTYHYGKHEYDAEIKITAYCPGEQPEGAPSKPGEGQFWVKVEFQGAYGSYVRWDLLELGGHGNTGVPIRLFYEATPGLKSWVETGEVVKFSNCGSGVIGPNPEPGQGTRDDNHNHNGLPWKWLGLAVVILLIILLIKI